MTEPEKPREVEVKRLLDLLGLIDMGLHYQEQEQEAINILTLALDQARREGFEMARNQMLTLLESRDFIGPFTIINLKYTEA